MSDLAPNRDLTTYHQAIQMTNPVQLVGRVDQVIGLTIESRGPRARSGELCFVSTPGGENQLPAEVVGFRSDRLVLMPLGDMAGIGPGSRVIASGGTLQVGVGYGLLGRVLDGLGNPMDGLGPLAVTEYYPTMNQPPNPLTRPRIEDPLPLGVRAIDGLLTCGKGQRIGIFAGSGVGKSTLMGMVARNTAAQVNVVALIGERGREVRDFIERDLGPEGLARSVVVVATSDQPALVRLRGAFVATAIAEYFRDQGMDVMFLMDSVTRFAMAQREVGLAVGEPPATRGYTPSVFALLPRLLERSGRSEHGSITGFYTVLVDGDDTNEPITDAVRGILDGHIVLSRRLAHQGHYPAIDVLGSISRLMSEIVPEPQKAAANRLRSVLATHREAEDLINIGAYIAGSNPQIDYARAMIDQVKQFLCQDVLDVGRYEETTAALQAMFAT